MIFEDTTELTSWNMLLIQSVSNTTKLDGSGNQNAKQRNHFQSKTLKWSLQYRDVHPDFQLQK